MKNTTLKFPIVFSIIIIILSSIVFISLENPKSNITKLEGKADSNTNKDLSKEPTVNIENFFPLVEGKVLNYSGVAEYGENLTVSKIINEQNKKTIILKGQIINLEDSSNKPSKNLEYAYEIYKDYVKVTTQNPNREFSQSIIDSHIALKTPIKSGNSWEEEVTINGENHKCKSVILDVSKDMNGKSLIKIQHIVEDMPNYPNDTYKEIKTYKEGLGLYQYESTILLPNDEDKSKPTPFDFKYKIFEDK
ncbi:hypothetical protein [Hathewaya massiliensis]|uniref:hypothetical protein n=1 Tax=Hathewaya massiliensis TaxID=1964382 RepID=UPI00115A283F|nr:hypothetical protein [Hathewaya massiliensis]